MELEEGGGGEDGAHLGGEGGGLLGGFLGEVLAGGGVDDAARGVDEQADFVNEAVAAHFLEASALGADAGDQEEMARCQTAHVGDEFAAGGAHDVHHVDGRTPFGGAFHDALEDAGTVDVGYHLEVLAALVGGEGQNHGPFVGEFEEGLDRVLAHVGGEGDGVDAVTLEEGLGVHAGGVADVAAFGVGNKEHFGVGAFDVGAGAFKGFDALGAKGLVEGKIRLVGHGKGGGGVDNGAVEGEESLGAEGC